MEQIKRIYYTPKEAMNLLSLSRKGFKNFIAENNISSFYRGKYHIDQLTNVEIEIV